MLPLPPSDALRVVVQELNRALAALDRGGLDRVRSTLSAPGRRWFVTGQGRSGMVATMTAMRLMHLGYDVHAVGEATAPALRSGDGLLVLSKSGATPATLSQTRVAKAEGALVVAVTAERTSPIAALADQVLVLAPEASAQFGGSRFEQSALIVLDALMLSLAPSEPDQRRMDRRHSNLH